MVDSNVVLSRITKIRECVSLLRKHGLTEEEPFLQDDVICGSAERQLQIAIQAVIDIGSHVIADMDLGAPTDYKDIFRILGEHNIVSKDLSEKLSSMTGLRNVLVHDYLEVDLKLIYRILKEDLNDFETYVAAILKLV